MHALDRLAAALNVIGTLIIVALMMMIAGDVIGRGALNRPLPGTAELSGMLIVMLVFLQLPRTVARHRMIRAEVLLGALAARRPRIAGRIEAGFRLLGALFFGAIAWASWPKLTKAWERETYVGASGDFTAPIWPMLAVVVLGSAFAAILYVVLTCRAAHDPVTAAGEIG